MLWKWATTYSKATRGVQTADADIHGPGSADFLADGPRIRQTKYICGHGPSADLKPRVLFTGPTSNGSANVPVLNNLKSDPYLDTAVGYVRKPVWRYWALGLSIGYSVIRPYLRMQTVRGHMSPLQLRTRTVRGPDACGRRLSADYPRTWNFWIRTPPKATYEHKQTIFERKIHLIEFIFRL